MEILDILQLLGGLGAVLGIIGGGLFGLSKFRNSKLRSTFEKVANEISNDKDKIHEIEVSIGKDEQKKDDLKEEQEEVDKELAKIESKPKKEATNDAVIDMFDKLSKKS